MAETRNPGGGQDLVWVMDGSDEWPASSTRPADGIRQQSLSPGNPLPAATEAAASLRRSGPSSTPIARGNFWPCRSSARTRKRRFGAAVYCSGSVGCSVSWRIILHCRGGIRLRMNGMRSRASQPSLQTPHCPAPRQIQGRRRLRQHATALPHRDLGHRVPARRVSP